MCGRVQGRAKMLTLLTQASASRQNIGYNDQGSVGRINSGDGNQASVDRQNSGEDDQVCGQTRLQGL